MAMGKKKFCALKSKSNSKQRVLEDCDLGFGSEFVQYNRGLGRKRILISGEAEEDSMIDSRIGQISPKRLCNETLVSDNGTSSRLQFLPQEILVRVLSGVEHEDLKQLFHVSKTMREATLIAKQTHFAYSTPKKTLVFRGDLGDEIEAPRAPRLERYRESRINRKGVSEISVSLFTE